MSGRAGDKGQLSQGAPKDWDEHGAAVPETAQHPAEDGVPTGGGTAVPDSTVDLTPQEDAEIREARVGPYELVRELGRGGMGSVWLARRADEQYESEVAVKLIRRGLDSGRIVERFRAERQILANLDHPNVARLLDGGTTVDGRPYFVMEHVAGTPITTYCDQKRLPTGERLRLFRGVCSAVHYAHQRLIIHRDLKPANILVTAEGVPKLLDFGIAKLVTPSASESDPVTATSLTERPMTPAYASPEQIRGEPMTTASDTYSLGVLLYELLTGHWPYDIGTRTLLEIQRAVCEQDPERPSAVVTRPLKTFAPDGSTGSVAAEVVSESRDDPPARLRRRLSGDLDNIVLKAMAKEPERRYASVERLSEDVLRHLEGRPVLARRATLRYRVTKFVTRNKALAAAGALGSLVLIGGVAGVAWQARIARSERARAVRRFNDVRELANSFIFELHDAIRDLPGATSARALLVKRALHYLDSLASESAGDASLQRELAAAYLRLGDVQGKPFEPNLGDTPGSMASYRKSAAIGEALLLAGHAEARRGLADAYGRIGDALAIQGDVGGATASLRQGLQLREALLAEAPRDRALTLDLALSHGRVADRLANLGDVKAALDSRRKALDLLTSLTASAPSDRELSERLGVAQQKLANNLGNPSFVNVGDTRAALENLEAAGSTFRGLLASDPKSAKLQRLVAVNLSNVSDVLDAQSDHGLALERQRRSLEFFQALADADPKDAQARSDVAVSCSKVGYLLSEIGDLAGAEASYLRALGIHRALSESDPSNASEREEVGVVLNRLGETLSLKGDLAGGLLQQQRAHAIIAALSQADPMNQMLRLSLAGACSAVGEAEAGIAAAGRDTKAAQAARWSEASVWYDKALGILGDLRAKGVLTGSDAGEPERVLALRETAGRALSASPRAR